jgi:hypothetical protein
MRGQEEPGLHGTEAGAAALSHDTVPLIVGRARSPPATDGGGEAKKSLASILRLELLRIISNNALPSLGRARSPHAKDGGGEAKKSLASILRLELLQDNMSRHCPFNCRSSSVSSCQGWWGRGQEEPGLYTEARAS